MKQRYYPDTLWDNISRIDPVDLTNSNCCYAGTHEQQDAHYAKVHAKHKDTLFLIESIEVLDAQAARPRPGHHTVVTFTNDSMACSCGEVDGFIPNLHLLLSL